MIVVDPAKLADCLRASAVLHRRLCPRQVLGARMALLAGELLGLDLPRRDKRLLAIVETDGCVVDGVAAASGCAVGRRTLRVEDVGQVAATFVDVSTERAVRVVPARDARARAVSYAPDAPGRWERYLLGYQRMPDALLLTWRPVELVDDIAAVLGDPAQRATCDRCGEDILNGREVIEGDAILCRSCARGSYYRVMSQGCGHS